MKPTKITFKGGGFIIVENAEDFKFHCGAKDFESYEDPSKAEIKDFREHQAFMKTASHYVFMIEDWVADRPAKTERFRYDANDIMNLMAFLINKKEPAKKRDQVEVISKAEFKEKLKQSPFKVLPGGADGVTT